MPNTNPTIVSASLSDKELQDSINKMVANFDKGLQDMLDHSNKYVEKIQESLQKIGNTNFGAKGSNDGGVAKQTKAQKEATNETERRLKKEKEVNLTLDQRAEIIGRIPREMRMPDMAKSARESFQAFYKGINEQARNLESLIKAEDNRLASIGLGRFSTETRSQLAQVDASIDQTRWKMNFLYQEEKRLNQEALRQKVGSVGFEQAWLKKDETKSARVREGERLIELEKERQRIIASDQTVQQLDRNIEQTRAKIQQLLADEKRLQSESLKQTVGSSEFERLWNQKYQVRDQRIAEQEKLIQLEKERQNLVSVDPIRTQLANVDELRAKHEKVLGVMRDETTTNNKVAESQQQVTSSTQQLTAEQKLTEEIRKQAQAIRESKEWQEKGFASVNGKVFYDSERVKGTKQHIREIGTLEEQILRSMQQQSIAERANTQEAQQRLDTIKRIAAEARAEMKQYGTSYHYTGYAVQNPFVYAENDARAKGLTIEQQIEQILKEQTKEYERQAEKIQQTTQKREKSAAQGVDKSFKTTLAQTLGVNTDEINSTGTSIKNLTAYSKQLQQAWEKLSSAGRHSPFGKQLQEELQLTQLQLQRVRNEASKPISLNFIKGMPEKTLNDIAYKIQQLQSYKRGLNITDPKQIAELNKANTEINRLQKDLNKYMGTAKQATEVNKALARSWNYMKNRLAFYFTIGAGTQFIKNLIEIRSEYELNERALGILIGSAERGTQIFNELSQMALVSPYTLIELSSAAKQLTAYDVAARDVVDTTRRLADMASAVGVPMERLTYALGQIKAYGYLNSRDNRMFANAGIPLVKQLADYYTELEGRLVSTADVYDRIKKKAVDYDTVMQVIYKMTDEGGKFFDFQAKMADTLKVRLANLTLAWNNMLNDMGKDSQGVLTWSIGALRTLFLHWKTLDKLIKNTAWLVGLRTAFMFLTWSALKLGGALGYTTKQMALSAVFGKRLAGVLKTVGGAMQTLAASRLTWFIILAEAAWEAGNMIFRANQATVELNKSLREGAETNFKDITEYLSQYQKVANSLYGGKKQYNSYDLRTGKVEAAASSPTDINIDEANKAWEAMRERIELSTAASDVFVGNLLEIENVSERLRQGFQLLNDIQQVNSAMRDMGDTAIVVTQDWSKWWNFFTGSDGLVNNLKDYKDAQDGATLSMEKFAQGMWRQSNFFGTAYNLVEGFYEKEDEAFEKLKGDIDETTESIDNFIRNMGFASNPDQIAEVYAQALKKISAQGNLDPQTAYVLQQGVEEARGKAMREALESRIADEAAALKLARDNETKESLNASIERNKARLELYTKYTADQRSEFERFTKYMKENHISEMQAMFGQMDEEQLKSINWQEGKYLDFVKRTAEAYAKRHNLAYKDVFNRLWSLIHRTNLMEIFLKLTISTEGGKSFVEQFKDADAQAEEAYANIKRLNQGVDDLKNKSQKLRAEQKNGNKNLMQNIALSTQAASADAKRLQVEKERAEQEKQLADAKSRGGHSKSEESDISKSGGAKNKERAKSQKQAESELQKALKDELQLIDKLRSQYKKLTDTGVASGEALNAVTNQFSNSIAHINKVLGKNGLPLFDIKAFLGTSNPRMLLDLLQSQLDAAKTAKNVKPSEIKELELKISELRVDVKAYDTKKVVDGLNNELDKLKDEYELAIELDANPELGEMFANMFDIDTSGFPKSIDEFMQGVQQGFDDLAEDDPLDIFKASDEDWKEWGNNVGLTEEALEKLKKPFVEARNVAKKWAQDTTKSIQDLRYKLADNNGKIAIEEENLANLRKQLAQETNDEQRKLLDLQIQDQQNAIAKLKEELLQLLPTYQRVFGEVAEHSVWMTRKLAKNYKNMLVEGKNRGLNPDNTYSVRDPITGQIARITKERMGKEIKNADKELRNTQSTVKKITEAFKKGEDGVVDWVHGIELIGEELGKMGQLVGVVSEIASAFGNPNEYNETAEILGDIGNTIAGLGQAAQGVAQIYSGDIIGGATNVVKGLWTSISTWLDNSDKKILQQIKDSETQVKRLENAYKDLEYSIEQAYGMAEYGARRAAIANQQLQLVELQRQLRLEESRDSKHRDEDRILELKGQIIDLRNEIKQSVDEITNDLLGISSIGDAAEQLVLSMIEAFKQGEDYMKQYDESFEKMIDNMIMKAIVSRVIGDRIEQMWNQIKAVSEQRGEADRKRIEELTKQLAEAQDKQMSAQAEYDNVKNSTNYIPKAFASLLEKSLDSANSELERIKSELAQAEKDYAKAVEPTKEDIDSVRNMADGWRESVKNEFEYWMSAFGIRYGEGADNKQLSALQQGIQSVTEDTAGALEAITNGISQQCYLQSDILIQIRDTVQSFDIDIQTASLSQILLQLQSSYQLQQSMLLTMENWTNPSGNAVRVELIS